MSIPDSTPLLYKIGKDLNEKHHFEQFRQNFTFDFDIDGSDSDQIIKKFLCFNLNISPDKVSDAIIVHKTIGNDGLKWHIDDCQIVTRKEPPVYDVEKFIPIGEGKYLFFKTPSSKLPYRTILFYSSTYGVDFEGGILRLVDKEIYPSKGNGIMFDSREVHMVTPVKSGIRKITLVKLY
jgi:hypothetical protein